MISFISSWTQQVIFAVIIGVILQMILPEGKNKKYIKVIIGVYVLFAIINPVIGKNIDMDLEEFNLSLENTAIELDNTNEHNIDEIFLNNLTQDIKSKIANKGYSCENIELTTNENYEIKKIVVEGIYELPDSEETQINSNNIQINEVVIGEKDNNIKEQVVKGISNSEEKKLKEFLSETYNVKEKNIEIS